MVREVAKTLSAELHREFFYRLPLVYRLLVECQIIISLKVNTLKDCLTCDIKVYKGRVNDDFRVLGL